MDTMLLMNESTETTTFEHLPPEILHIIFDYLTGDTILKSFLHINNRFDSLIPQVRLNTIDLSNWTRREIIGFSKHFDRCIFTDSLSLKLTNQISSSNFCSANIEFIFSSVLDSNRLKCLAQNLQQLILIRPIIDTGICFPDIILQSFLIYSSHDKIIFRKNIFRKTTDTIMVCSNKVLRSVLVDCGGIYNQIFINFQHPHIETIKHRVRHLKLHVDNYKDQWMHMSTFIVPTISELTLLIIDDQFEHYDGNVFSSLLLNISANCHLHFYLQCIPETPLVNDTTALVQSFQNDFYIQHQANIIIAYYSRFLAVDKYSLYTYTLPLCASQFQLTDNEAITNFDIYYNNISRIILDPCGSNYHGVFHVNDAIDILPNLTSLELIRTHNSYFNRIRIPIYFRQIASRIYHLHINNIRYLSDIFRFMPPLSFDSVRYLDITDDDINCTILENILNQSNFCRNICHLNISGLCRLKCNQIEHISHRFHQLQTLRFLIRFVSSFNEQLNTICRSILISMRSHLQYLHIYFEQDDSSVMSFIPSENQLSEWLGDNQTRLSHVDAIELTRNELSVWL